MLPVSGATAINTNTTTMLQPRKLTAAPVQKCTTGCPIIDAVLRGGVPCGTITELVGARRGVAHIVFY